MPPSEQDRLERLGVRSADVEESFTRSGGKGGQNVNKVSTAVILRHLPTGVTVRCEESRSQAENRRLARLRLAEKLEERQRRTQLAERQARERKRRAARRPSRQARERALEQKRRRAEVKKDRSRPGLGD